MVIGARGLTNAVCPSGTVQPNGTVRPSMQAICGDHVQTARRTVDLVSGISIVANLTLMNSRFIEALIRSQGTRNQRSKN